MDNDQDETLLVLVKDFNFLIKDVNLFKGETIGSEEHNRPFMIVRSRYKLVVIKEIYRKFRSCLKREVQEVKLVKDQQVLTIDNYTGNNT